MESQIDLMVRQVAINLGVTPPVPNEKKPPEKNDALKKIPTADVNIDGVSLKEQSELVRKAGNDVLADGLLRAAELVNISEEYLLKMHKLIQPMSGNKAEYLMLATDLINMFGAEKNADMIIRIMQRYDKEGKLR